MASKLRRTPLFGYDGNLGIPVNPGPNSVAQNGSGKPSGSYHHNHQVRSKPHFRAVRGTSYQTRSKVIAADLSFLGRPTSSFF